MIMIDLASRGAWERKKWIFQVKSSPVWGESDLTKLLTVHAAAVDEKHPKILFMDQRAILPQRWKRAAKYLSKMHRRFLLSTKGKYTALIKETGWSVSGIYTFATRDEQDFHWHNENLYLE